MRYLADESGLGDEWEASGKTRRLRAPARPPLRPPLRQRRPAGPSGAGGATAAYAGGGGTAPQGQQVTAAAPPGDIAYPVTPGEEYGARWRSRRPPGLPARARQASARGAATPHVEQLARAQGLSESFVRTIVHLAFTESTARFGLPANNFDNRPPAARSGKDLVTAWGAFQFNRDAWRSLPDVTPDAFPWDASALEEIARPVARYAQLYRSVVAARGSARDAARGIRLWHITPTGFRQFLDRARRSGFAAAWQQVPADTRSWIDARLTQAGVVAKESGEQAEAPSPNVFINPRVDVDAQRALIAMSRSANPADRADAALLLTLLRARLLCGIYKEDQEVPAKLARLHGSNWWQTIRPGTNARLACDDWAARGQRHRGERECAGTLLIVRRQLSREQLVAVLRAAAARQRTGAGITRRCPPGA